MPLSPGPVLDITQKKSFTRLGLASGFTSLAIDIVPPPKSWNIDEAMLEKFTHININIKRIQLRHGLGVIGRSALEKNVHIDTAEMEAREADFRISELCMFPETQQLRKLE